MHKQLILLHNAIAAYFSGNAVALDNTLKQFNIKVNILFSQILTLQQKLQHKDNKMIYFCIGSSLQHFFFLPPSGIGAFGSNITFSNRGVFSVIRASEKLECRNKQWK